MELGKATVRTTGVNLLTNALHPGLGVIWTDGQGLHVAPVTVAGGRLTSTDQTRLGEFDSVQGVHWSAVEEGGACYLCVVHPQAVTVWRVRGSLPRPNFKQVRKINIQVIPQGCLWNPACEVLCLLTRHQCSFYYGHQGQRGSFAFPSLESGRISAACWSQDGTRLVVCTGTVLLIYTWADIGKSVSEVTPMAWKIPSVSGNVTAVVPVDEDSFVCSVEPAPESFCKTSESLVTPDGRGQEAKPAISSSLLILDRAPDQPGAMPQLVMVRLRGLYQDPIRTASTAIPGILSPDLLVFEERSQSVVVGSNSRDRLLLFSCHRELVFTQEIVLGQRERPKGVCRWSSGDGGGGGGGGLLVLVGDREPSDEAFPSKSSSTKYSLTLKFFPIHLGVPASAASLPSRQRPTVTSAGKNARELMRTQSERTVSLGRHRADISPPPTIAEKDEAPVSPTRSESGRTADDEDAYTSADIDEILDADLSSSPQHAPSKHSLMNGGPGVSLSKRPLVEELGSDPSSGKTELETERVQFSEVEPVFKNPAPGDFNPVRETVRPAVDGDRMPGLDLNGKPPHSLDSPRSVHSADSSHSAWSNGSHVSPRSQGSPPVPRRNSSPLSVRSSGSSHSCHSRREPGTERNGGGVHGERRVGTASSERLSRYDTVTRTAGEGGVVRHDRGSAAKQEVSKAAHSSHSGPHASGDHHKVSSSALAAGKETQHTSGGHPCMPVDGTATVEIFSEDQDESLKEMEELLLAQEEQISALQKRVAELTRRVEESSCVAPSQYQEPDTPELVHITCRQYDGTIKRRTFILDQGRVQYEPLKHVFRLSTVEIMLDGEPCIVGPNTDGYIPMRFKAGSSVHITGLPDYSVRHTTSNH